MHWKKNNLHIIPEVFYLHNIILWSNEDHMFPLRHVLLRPIVWQQKKKRFYWYREIKNTKPQI